MAYPFNPKSVKSCAFFPDSKKIAGRHLKALSKTHIKADIFNWQII